MKKYEIGLVLGGGGARGFAHLGVLKALAEKGITPDIISGVSAGAIAGVFLAAGESPEKTRELLQENRFTDYARANLPRNGLLSLANLKGNLEDHLTADTFSDLEVPFYAAVSDLYTGEIHYLEEGPLIPIVQASASIPVLFSPVEIDGCLYVDGGLLDNLPIKPLLDKCEKIIVINVMPIERSKELDNLVEVAARTFQLSVSGNNRRVKKQSDLFIEPDGLEDYHILETSKSEEIFEIGYNYCKELEIKL